MDDLLPAQPPEMPVVQTPAQNLMQLIKQLIKEEQYEGVALLFTSETEAPRNLACICEMGLDLYHDVCILNLTMYNHREKMGLYVCAEELLKIVASHASPEEMLMNLLEAIEENKSEYVFTSLLRGLQLVLLRLGDSKPLALEWGLHSIHSRLELLPIPEYCTEGYDKRQERLLEQSDEIQTVLMHYITVELFYEPILNEITKKQRSATELFRDYGVNRRNVLCCFLVQMLGKPLALLDLTIDERKSNTYTLQCARNLTNAVTQCIGDPFYFLTLVEQRVRWEPRLDPSKGVYEMSSENMFLIKDKLPLTAVAIYYYMLLVEEVNMKSIPKVYSPFFIFEAGMYLVNELLMQHEPALQNRAILLVKYLLDNLHETAIPSKCLDLAVHRDFCTTLCRIIGYSLQVELRQRSIVLLNQYILQFDTEGKYLILKNLLRSVEHCGISGYLATIYKNLVANALRASSAELAVCFSGQDFRSILLQYICKLPHGEKTDIIEQSDKIICTLNALRLFALTDQDNRTGFWNFVSDVQQSYLDPLRKGLELSVAHYKHELCRVEAGLDDDDESSGKSIFNIDIPNNDNCKPALQQDVEWTQQQKINVLNQKICTFDLIHSLLARATECIENTPKLSQKVL